MGCGEFLGEQDILLNNKIRELTAISRDNKLVVYFIEINVKPNIYISFFSYNRSSKK